MVQYAAPSILDDYLDAPFSIQEVKDAIPNSKLNKAPGDDRIPFEFFKHATEKFVCLLTAEFNRIFESASVPEAFQKSIIFPLHKKGSYEDPANYRGISFLNTCVKLFAGLIHNRLSKWVENKKILSEFQAGFRKSYSTIDHIFSLLNIADLYKRRQKKLYAFFIDFRAAFDSVDREALFYKLCVTGVSSKVVSVLRAMYANNLAYVWDGESISEEFATVTGLKQGCILSALLFIIFINDITDEVRGGIVVEGLTIPALMYADDIVLFSETIDGMQLMINRLGVYCNRWNLEVNLQKSKMMIFRGGGGRYSRNEKWKYNGQTVDIVREYKYLGVLLTSNLNMKKHLEGKLAEAKRAISSLWERCIRNRYVEHSSKQKLFRSTALSILFYGAQVWGHSSFESVEKFLRYFVKRIFRLPKNTPNYMIYLESGIPPLVMDTLAIHFNYIVKVIEMEESRLPKKVLKAAIKEKGTMFGEWTNLATTCGTNLNITPGEQPSRLRIKFNEILEQFGSVLFERYASEARSSLFRCYYSRLRYNLQQNSYLLNRNSLNKINIIFKARGELLNLNFVPHRPDLPLLCSLCNMKAREDTLHFIAICPVLIEFRLRYFSKRSIEEGEMLSILNGDQGWDGLYNYIVTALRYRKAILEEDF